MSRAPCIVKCSRKSKATRYTAGSEDKAPLDVIFQLKTFFLLSKIVTVMAGSGTDCRLVNGLGRQMRRGVFTTQLTAY